MYTIMKSGGNPVITSSGITVEANTRRFVIDEKKEKKYRAEVQNRIFKRELIEVSQRNPGCGTRVVREIYKWR